MAMALCGCTRTPSHIYNIFKSRGYCRSGGFFGAILIQSIMINRQIENFNRWPHGQLISKAMQFCVSFGLLRGGALGGLGPLEWMDSDSMWAMCADLLFCMFAIGEIVIYYLRTKWYLNWRIGRGIVVIKKYFIAFTCEWIHVLFQCGIPELVRLA